MEGLTGHNARTTKRFPNFLGCKVRLTGPSWLQQRENIVSENAEARSNIPDLRAIVTNGLSELAAAGKLDTFVGQDGFFHSLIEALPVAIYATDAEGRITYFNAAAAKLWGRTPDLGEDMWCGSWRLFRMDGTAMAHDDCPMAVVLKTGKPVRGHEAIAERPDGSRFPFIPYPTPMFDAAGKLIGAVNLLMDTTGRENDARASRHLAAIVESSEDAVISKNMDGVIQSWNAAAERMFGYTAPEIVGRSVLNLIPPERHHEEDEILRRLRLGERLEHFETVRRAKDGSLIDVSLTVSPIKDASGNIAGASKIVRDISMEKRAHRQLEILHRTSRDISRDLNLERVVQTVTDLATDACGAKFGAFFYNVENNSGESYMLYSLSGASRESFEKLGMPRNTAIFAPTFHGTGIVRSGDIRKDPRYGLNGPHFGMPRGHLPVVSYLAVPVLSAAGEVHGGLFFGHDQPNMFSEDSQTLVAAIAAQAAVAMDNARLHRSAEMEIERRRKAEEIKELLLNEIKHRVKNTLGTVQAMATQTFREAPDGEKQAFGARIQALAQAHEGLNQRNWQSATMLDTAERSVRPFLDDGWEKRISLNGPAVELRPNTALLVAMLLHELGTNAVKYGALSNLAGSVNLAWCIEKKKDGAILRLEWKESGGPGVSPPTRKGFGSRLIERALRGENGTAEMRFEPAGLRCFLTIPLIDSLGG
jgi:PAS domain S-box-containing protein